jgi:hypothetical protein
MRTLALVPLLLAALLVPACGAGQEAGSGSGSTVAEPEPEPTAVPEVARVTCTADGTVVGTPTVAAQPDGVHIEIVNELDAERAFSLTSLETGLGFGAPPGTTNQVIDLPPGALTVACTDPAVAAEGGEPIEVVDPEGIWVSTTLACPEQFSQVSDYIQGAEGETSDPLEAARKAIEAFGLEPDDVFEPAGYPEAEVPRVRLVRDGEPLAVVDLIDDGEGKWLVGTVTGCSSLEGTR